MIKNKFILGVLLVLIIASCKKEDDDIIITNDVLFADMLETLGGSTAINAATSIKYSVTGIANEFQEDPEPVNELVANYSYDLTYMLNGENSKQSWSIQTDYAYESDFSFVEVLDGTKGTSEGTTGFFSQYFAGFGVLGDPMFSTKLAARQKTNMMSSPLAMAKMISSGATVKGGTLGTFTIGFNTSNLGFGAATPDLELVINTTTKLPLKSQVIENDPLYGDVVYEVEYSNWTTVDGIQYPGKLTHIFDGHVIRIETLNNIEINPSFDVADLTVTASDWTYDANEAKSGHISSQFHYRMLMVSFAEDFPVEFTEATDPSATPSATVPNDANVYRVSGDFQSHYTYAFKVNGELVIYDSPLNNKRTSAALNKIRTDFSTDPIKYVVNSHNHFDHIGGIRGSLAEGGDLVVGAGSKTAFESILQKPYTVLSNPIEGLTVNVVGVTEEMVVGTGDDQIILYILPTEHAETDDFIMIYKPSTQTIYMADVYNPGFGFAWAGLGTFNQERSIRLAKDIVNFVDSKGITVLTSYAIHGFVLQDNLYSNIVDMSNM